MGERRLVDVDDLTSVANHIRTKGGTSSTLEFPNGFNSAIDNISSDYDGTGFFEKIYGDIPSNE